MYELFKKTHTARKIRTMLRSGVNPCITNMWNETPLHYHKNGK